MPVPSLTQMRALRALAKRGYSLEQIARVTCFTAKQLRAIFGNWIWLWSRAEEAEALKRSKSDARI